ncbi:SycD/LcrH family type III secretion system chaperone BcrH1 [Melaminivora jejuensis]|uniref:SycD/LcrH family type III secretion system chaperone n=1 Tax=Melaminivora jejuensis TaxID=1267217 RepID=UPI001ADFFF3B|nr:SycD/LcrH family type III secretion system chaperone [Melaminivora jejuensis]UHJ66035.1 SycD/LcrH family type III secretion system chaperone [Melaminivora jejuensis]
MNNPIAQKTGPENLGDQIADLLANGGTLGSVFDYEDADYEVLYALGHSLYAQARYHDAMRVFGYLVMCNHMEKRFMNAFASSLQMLGSHKDAIKYYSLASVMDMSDPLPTFHTAECMLAIGMQQEAREALGYVLQQSEAEQYAELRQRAQAMLDLLGGDAAATSH